MKTKTAQQFKIGQTVFYPRFISKDAGVKTCGVVQLKIERLIPNYLNKHGLYYAAGTRPTNCMAYRPESLYVDREEAVTALRARVQTRIDNLTAALEAIV